MTYAEAAIAVLKLRRHPLTTREITEVALQRGLIRPTGKTPEATMAAVLYQIVRDASDPQVVKVFSPGPTRAARGSVRWTLKG
jgi:hypothetical protein